MSERNVSSRVDEQESHCLRVPSFHYGSGGLISFESSVVRELVVRLVVNGQQADTLTCSPWNVEELTYGRLYFNGIIRRASDVIDMRIDVDAGLVDVLISDTMGAASDSLLEERSVLSYVTPRWIIDNMAQFERIRAYSAVRAGCMGRQSLMREASLLVSMMLGDTMRWISSWGGA